MFGRHAKPPVVVKTKKQIFIEYFLRYIALTIGVFITAAALECFLVPNNVIDGGVIGSAMIISSITKMNLGLLIFIIDIPFIILALQKFQKSFVIQTFYSVLILAFATNLFHSHNFTHDLLLTTVFGGILLGLGVGIILRNNGSLDGTEILSIWLSQKYKLFSVGQMLMGINMFVYTAAGLVFGWDKAMYSVLTYFIASRVIDMVMEGFNKMKSVRIFSPYYKEIGSAIMKELDISVTYMRGMGGYSREEKIITYCIVSRFDLPKLKDVVINIDPAAFFAIGEVFEVHGGRLNNK